MKKIFILILLILTAAPAFADMIYLKNGRKVEGEIIGQTDTYLEAKLKTLTVKFDLKNVQSVEKKELPEDFFSKSASTRSDNLKAEGYSVAENPLYKIMTKAAYNKAENIVEVEGDVILPGRSTIYVALKKDNNIIDSLQTAVNGSRFTIKFGPFKNPLEAGDYRVETTYLQPEKAKSAKTGQAGKEAVKAVFKLTVSD